MEGESRTTQKTLKKYKIPRAVLKTRLSFQIRQNFGLKQTCSKTTQQGMINSSNHYFYKLYQTLSSVINHSSLSPVD